jgi:ligand-binding sensor domain-containing protein
LRACWRAWCGTRPARSPASPVATACCTTPSAASARIGRATCGCTRAGLNRLKDGKFTGYTEKDGLPHPTIEALGIDEQDALWIGTRRGVSRFKDGRFTSYGINDGMLANYVSGFASDGKGNLWMGSGRGLFTCPSPTWIGSRRDDCRPCDRS